VRAIRRLREIAGGLLMLGAYHYLDLLADGANQARQFFTLTLPLLMQSHPDDLLPMVDVEFGAAGARNNQATKQQIEDCCGGYAGVVRAYLGQGPILYGNRTMAERGITSHMGCSHLCIARYSDTLPEHCYKDIGWERPWAWQYAGTGPEERGRWAGGPPSLPLVGECDISVAIAPDGGPATVRDLRRATMVPR
jgi:GH25 family lysozyme M1 (1,4-beta-N-acetylmuramidase)